MKNLIFAFNVCRYVKSNAIVIANNKQILGVGAGQKSRVDSLKKEIQKNSTYVGNEFVSKVRSMKEGKIKEKPIHGQGTHKEIQELRDEGIDVVNIPWISDDH